MITKDNNDKGRQILKVAIRYFSDNGFERVKISDITNEAGIGKGTFYLYYKNKIDLLLDCFKELEVQVSQLEHRRVIRDEKDFCLRMKNRMMAFEKQYANMSGILHLLRNACNSNDLTIRENARKSYSAFIIPLRDDIQNSIKNGEISDINPELGAYIIVGMAESLAFRVHLDMQSREEATTTFYNAIKLIFLPASAAPKSSHDFNCVITDRKSVSSAVRNILFDGKNVMTGRIGDAEIIVDNAKIKSLTVNDSDARCIVDMFMKDGQSASISVAKTTTVTGETSIGICSIPIHKVKAISFQH